MIKRCLCTAFLLTASLAFADTVHFKDGSSLDGKVSRPNANSVVVRFRQRLHDLPRPPKWRASKRNDRTGAKSVSHVHPMSAARSEEMKNRTRPHPRTAR